MLMQQVELLVRPGREAAVEAALCEVRRRVFMMRGFRGFAVHQEVDDRPGYLVQVRWETLDELLDCADSGRFERCWVPVQDHLEAPLRVRHFEERPSLGSQGPGVVTDLDWLRA